MGELSRCADHADRPADASGPDDGHGHEDVKPPVMTKNMSDAGELTCPDSGQAFMLAGSPTLRSSSSDWPLSRQEKKERILRLYERDFQASDKLLQTKDANLEALREELTQVRRVQSGSSIAQPFAASKPEAKRRWSRSPRGLVGSSLSLQRLPAAESLQVPSAPPR